MGEKSGRRAMLSLASPPDAVGCLHPVFRGNAAVLIAGFGQFIFWERGSLYIGSAVSPSELHSHHAIQLSLGLQGRVQFKTTADSSWVEYDGAVIPPDLVHTFQ